MKHGAIPQSSEEPAFTTPVITTAEELRIAQELRRQLRQRYRDEIDRCVPIAVWCVSAD